jgi:hypothetical protein
LFGGTLEPNGSCSISVDVKAITPGVKINTTAIGSSEGGSGSTISASITILPATADIPVLDRQMLMVLAALLCIAAMLSRRKRR